MTPLLDPKREQFARGLAAGEEPWSAWFVVAKSFARAHADALAVAPDVVARVAGLLREQYGDGPEDLVPVISRYMRWADEARALKTAAGMVAARGFLAEAARLKRPSSRRGPPAVGIEPNPDPDMSDEEWLAQFAPGPRP